MPTITTQVHKRRQRARWLLGSVVTLLCTAYIAVAALAATVLSTPRRVAATGTPAEFSLPFADASFPARGGDVQLRGWFIPQEGAKRAIVIVHGKDNSGLGLLRDGFAPLVRDMHERGFAVLLLDLRGHGRSGDGRFSFGLNERRDVAGAVDWLKTQGFAPGRIGVYAQSLGSASSILATADDADIGALVSDCSYAAILPIIEREWTQTSRLPQFVLPGTLLFVRLFYGYDLAAARPIDVVGSIAPRPLLIIHGQADMLIPVAEAEALHAAAPGSELWTVADAGHGSSYLVQGQAYIERVIQFFDRSIGL